MKLRFPILAVSVILGTVVALASNCQETNRGSTLGTFGRDMRFPMYYTVAGQNASEGEIYRISAITLGQKVEPELLVTGLDFPTGITVDATGTVFFTEALPTPDGRVRKISPNSKEPVDVVSGLNYPIGVAVDAFGKVYVLEAASKSLLKVAGDGTSEVFLEEMTGTPRAALTDLVDNLLLVELGTNVLSKISPKGDRHVISQEVTNPAGVGLSPTGEIYLLVNNTGGEDGQLLKIGTDGSGTDVAGVLTNPLGMAIEATGSIYVSEGDPVNRIIRVSLSTGSKSLIARTGVNPFGIAFTPF